MAAVPLDTVRANLFSSNGLIKIAWLDKARGIQWMEENSKPGWATFEVPLENEDGTPYAPIVHLLDRRIVKFWWYHQGKRNGTFACRLKGEAVTIAKDGRRWLRFEQQPGLLDMLGDATIYPEYGLRRQSSGTRIFGFMSKDGNWRADGNWHYPTGFTLANMTGTRKGAPVELRKANPYWIAARNPHTLLSPTTVNYFRASFHMAAGKYCELNVAADNILTVYLDGEEIISPDKTTPLQWKHTQSVRVRIPAGDHVLGFKDENAPMPGDADAYTPVGLIGVLYELDDEGKVAGTILETNLDGDVWRVHDNTPQPGWSRAQVLRQCVIEAKARGVDAVTYLRLGFGDFHDTAGRAWTDIGEYQFDVGTVSLSDVAQQLAEAKMDVAVDPTSMRLQAWRRRGRDRSATVQLLPGDIGGNLKAFESAATAARFTTVLTQTADGVWVETSDAAAIADPHRGRIEVGLSLGSAPGSSTANSLAKSQLFENSQNRSTVTSEPSTLTGPIPYKHYFVGDSIAVPGRRNIGMVKARVLSITVDASGEGVRAWPEYVAELSSIPDVPDPTAPVPLPPPPPPAVGGWFDDFTATVNTARWNVRNNDSSNNNEAFYVAANVGVQSDGTHLTAKRQTGLSGQPSDHPFTSGYLDTVGKFSATTGRWEVVAKLPTFKGAWPAIWLRCDSTLGEIDILEAVGGLPHKVVQTVHESTNDDMDKSGFEYNSTSFDPAAWHTYALERHPDGGLFWYIDGALTRTALPAALDNQHNVMSWLNGSTFASPLNLRINLQVGGDMPTYYGNNVDGGSALPGDMVIRSVRYSPLP